MQRCTTCNHLIAAGAEEYAGRIFCSTDCISKLQAAVAEQSMSPEDLDAKTEEVFQGGCPKCGAQRPVDVYTARKLTGMILAIQNSSTEEILCVTCARKLKFGAFAHCLFLGWWSPHAFFFNLFLVPISLISALCTKEATQPTQELRDRVKRMIGDILLTQNVLGAGT